MHRLTALALALCLVLTGCAGQAQPSAEPTSTPAPTPTATPAAASQPFALSYDPGATLHPITGTSQVNLDLAPLVYQGLYALDNAFVPQPVLAQSAQVSEDGRVWTITLAQGVTFSDGTPLTAGHVVSSLNTAAASTLYASRLAGVSGVQAGDGQVMITLSVPNGNLPALLDIPIVLEQGSGAPLGTGRYRFADTGEGLELQANGAYADRLPYQSIPLHPTATADERIAAFDSGEVTAVTTDFSSPYALGYSSSYETYDYPTTNLLYVGFRTTGGVCQSAQVRQAFSQVFDRNSVVRSLLSGHGEAACLPIFPRHADYPAAAAEKLDYDVQAAAQLLEGSGFSKGEDGLFYQGGSPVSVKLIVNSDNTARQNIADFLARSLTSLGVQVEVRKLAWEDYNNALLSGQYDLYLGEVRMTADFDPTALLAGNLNYGGYASQQLPTLLGQWKAAQGEGRNQAAQALYDLFAQEVPIAPLCFRNESMLVRWGMVTNLTPTRGDPYWNMEAWQHTS